MSFIHAFADVAECTIGEGTKVWQFVVILKGAAVVGSPQKFCGMLKHSE